MPIKFKFLEHTADVKFQAFGKSPEEVFANSAYALKEIICQEKIKNKIKKNISVEGKDNENLLYNFLEEFLVLFDSEGFVLSEIEKLEISKEISDKKRLINKGKIDLNNKGGGWPDKLLKLSAEATFDKAENYEISEHIKAITYNEMFIKKENNKWIAQVVVDV